jgi:hypothetical protein
MIYQPIDLMARETGLEPATSGVTGRTFFFIYQLIAFWIRALKA